MSEYLLELENLRTHFPVNEGVVFERRVGTIKAVDGVTLRVREGEVLGLVGESGCGKSTLARAILQIVPITEGRIRLDGEDLAGMSPRALRRKRPAFQMIFQDPYASLNPRMTVFDAIAEPVRVHAPRRLSRDEVAARVAELMRQVGLAPRFMKKYPHEFSGGQRQRIAIARALALDPRLVIADEPVSALDVSVQAQILNLLADLCRKNRLTMILISHDLAVVRHLSHRIAVMYLGKIVELGEAAAVLDAPLHPYTQALISAVPAIDAVGQSPRIILRGDPPSPINPPPGCPFHPRCPIAIPECAATVPPLEEKKPGHEAACIRV